MSDIRLTLRRGRYFAGVDIPFFVPNGAIRSGVADLGGENVSITDREDAALPFDPAKVDPKYSDDWAEVVAADYPGPTKTIETPRRWKWLVIVPSSSAPSSSTPAPSSSTPAPPKPVERSSSGALVALGLLAAAGVGGVLLWRRARRRR